MLAVFCLWVLGLAQIVTSINLVPNPGFEDGIIHPWTDHNAVLKLRTDDAHSGKYSLEVSYRIHREQGLSQQINIQQGGYYKFTAFVKQLHGRHGDGNFRLFETYNASIIYTWTNDGSEELYQVAFRPFVQTGSGWVSLVGEHEVPERQFSKSQILIHGPEADVDFLVDDVSLDEVYTDHHWDGHYKNSDIAKIRTSTVHVEVRHPPSYLPGDIEIKLDHKRHLFGFGCRVNQDWILDPTYNEYQRIFYKMFNWATLDGFEWTQNQGTEDKPDYSKAERAMNKLIHQGVHLRGHAMFWGVPGKSPDWVEKLDGSAMKTAIQDRVTYITNITRGNRISHWDVYNELLHGQLYDETTRDANFSKTLYDLVHQDDPHARLYLNDFDVVTTGSGTQAYIDLAKSFKAADAALYGLGAECHVNPHNGPTSLWKDNLDDLIKNTGLPVWISELSVNADDISIRASWFEKLLRLYFGTPGVEGITLNGFWDHDTDVHASLVNGFNYKLNRVGTTYMNLVHNQWSTHVSYNLSTGPIHPVTSFQGDYDVTVYYKGKQIKTESFSLGTKDRLYMIVIDGTEQEITLSSTPDPFAHVNSNKYIEHVPPTMIGTMNTSASNTDIQCQTRWSGVSEFGVPAETHVHCNDDEVLTGCSSINVGHSWLRGGESIEVRRGHMSCSAKTLASSTQGVQAVARCCKTSDLACNYWRASADTLGPDEKMETDCPAGYITTGCSTQNDQGQITQASPANNHRGCYTHEPRSWSATSQYGTCCQAPALWCKREKSFPSNLKKGDNITVTCGHGYIMTSCNVESYSGKTAGAFIELGAGSKDRCVAVNGEDKFTGDEGAIAVAVCCRLDATGAPLVG